MTSAPPSAPAKQSNRTPHADTAALPFPVRPLKPRRGLFALLLCAWALWIGALLWTYFHDVKPSPLQPHPATLRAVANL